MNFGAKSFRLKSAASAIVIALLIFLIGLSKAQASGLQIEVAGLLIAVLAAYAVAIAYSSLYSRSRVGSYIHVALFQALLCSFYLLPSYRLFGWGSPMALFQARLLKQSQLPTRAPGLHSMSVIVSEVLSIPLETAVKWVPLVLVVITTLFVVLLARASLPGNSTRFAPLAGLLIASMWYYTEFHTYAVKETLGLALAAVSLFAIYRSMQYRRNAFFSITVVAATGTVVAHELSTVMLLVAFVGILATTIMAETGSVGWFMEVNSTQAERRIVAAFLLVCLLTVSYWMFSGLLQLVLPALGVSVAPVPEVVGGLKSILLFESRYSAIQLLWRGGYYHAPLLNGATGVIASVVFVTIVAYASNWRNLSLTYRETAHGVTILLCMGMFIISYFSATFSATRVVTITWVFAIPVFVGAVSRLDRNQGLAIIATILVLNVSTLPLYYLSNGISPDRSAGQLGGDFQTDDYSSTSWLREYGTAPAASDVKHLRLFEGYAVETVGFGAQWIIAPHREVPNAYLYSTPSTQELLILNTGRTRHPPRYGELPVFDKIHSTGSGRIYYAQNGESAG